jgi:hypothetical protein
MLGSNERSTSYSRFLSSALILGPAERASSHKPDEVGINADPDVEVEEGVRLSVSTDVVFIRGWVGAARAIDMVMASDMMAARVQAGENSMANVFGRGIAVE